MGTSVPAAATPAPAGGGLSYSQLLDSNGNRWPELDLGLGRAGGAGGVLPRPAAFPDTAGAAPRGPVDVLPQLSPGCGHGIGMAKATAAQGSASERSATCTATLDQLRDITALKDKVIARLGDKLRAHEASVGEVVDALKQDLEAERSAHQHSKLELRDALCGNFDIIPDRFSRISHAFLSHMVTHASHTARCRPLERGARGYTGR